TGLPSIGDVSARFASGATSNHLFCKTQIQRLTQADQDPKAHHFLTSRNIHRSWERRRIPISVLGARIFRSAPKIRCHSIFIRDAAEMFQNREALVGLAARNPFEEGKRRWASEFHRCCSRALTRLLNDA